MPIIRPGTVFVQCDFGGGGNLFNNVTNTRSLQIIDWANGHRQGLIRDKRITEDSVPYFRVFKVVDAPPEGHPYPRRVGDDIDHYGVDGNGRVVESGTCIQFVEGMKFGRRKSRGVINLFI